MRALLLTALALGCAAPAHAGFEGAALAHYEGSYAQSGIVEDDGDARAGLGLARLRLRGVLPWRRGPAMGLDLAVGSTRPGGFAYDASLYVLGVGTRIGDYGSAGITAGIGASGAVGTMDDAAIVPVALWFETALGGHLRLITHGRALWTIGSDARRGGSPSASFIDEFEAMAALRLGRRFTDYGMRAGNGWFIGAAYREAADTRFLGGVIGYSIDIAGAVR